MSVTKVNEVIGSSTQSFEDAAQQVIKRAYDTLRGLQGIEVLEKRVKIEDDQIREYRVRLRLVFDLAPETVLHV